MALAEKTPIESSNLYVFFITAQDANIFQSSGFPKVFPIFVSRQSPSPTQLYYVPSKLFFIHLYNI